MKWEQLDIRKTSLASIFPLCLNSQIIIRHWMKGWTPVTYHYHTVMSGNTWTYHSDILSRVSLPAFHAHWCLRQMHKVHFSIYRRCTRLSINSVWTICVNTRQLSKCSSWRGRKSNDAQGELEVGIERWVTHRTFQQQTGVKTSTKLKGKLTIFVFWGLSLTATISQYLPHAWCDKAA